MLTTDVLPAPDGPNNAVAPRAASKRTRKFERAELLLHVDGEHDHSP